MTGYEKLAAAVKKDCSSEKSCDCFNPNGCDKANRKIGEYGKPGYKSCCHAYCDKFRWVIDRANHYAEKTGLDWEDILDAWEVNRNYWYMNYYQESNQPKIEDGKVHVFEDIQEFRKSVGTSGFRCPHCGGISTDPCECNAGKCDWKSYGLFQSDTVHVFFKSNMRIANIFRPVAWETQNNKK